MNKMITPLVMECSIKITTNYPQKCVAEFLERYPDTDCFIVTVCKGKLKLIPRLPQIEYHSISTSELCAIVAKEQGKEIHILHETLIPQPNIKY